MTQAPTPANADSGWLRQFLLVAAITGISVGAAHLARPMVTYRAIGLGASTLEIGLVQSAYSVLPVLTAIAVGRSIDRIGGARILVLGCGTLTLGGIAAALSDSLIGLAFGQLLMGFGLISTAIAGQAIVANQGPEDQRVRRFGWFAVAVSVGQMTGPGLGALLAGDAAGSAPRSGGGGGGGGSSNPEMIVFVAAAIAAGTALALALALRRDGGHIPAPASAEPHLARAAARILRRPGIAAAMFVSLAVTSGLDVLIAYLPLYGEANGLSVATVGALLSVRAGASLVSRAFMGRLHEALGLGRLLVATSGIAAAAFLLLPLIGAVPLLFVLMIVIGLCLGIGQPLSIVWIANRSPAGERGLALGVRLTGNLGALLIVPTLMGAIAGLTGIGAIWVVLAVFLGIATTVAWFTPFRAIAEGPAPAEPAVTA